LGAVGSIEEALLAGFTTAPFHLPEESPRIHGLTSRHLRNAVGEQLDL
jgi:hypothetical protein